ncbi:MAG: hypothetical protein GEU79_18005 [Acidimicrobiia bacterium]|nr:hypothetical protein [Acidimicrobiia bacterium]
MSRMQKTLIVARREFVERFRSRAFQFAAAATLVLLLAGIFVPPLFSDDETVYEVGLIGNGSEIVTAAENLANAREEDPTTINTTVFEDVETAEAAIEDDAVEAVLVDGSELIVASAGGFFGGGELVPLLQEAAATTTLEELVGTAEGSRVLDVLTGEALQLRTLEETDSADPARNVMAYAGTILLYIAILIYGSWVLTGVTEEKSSRVSEVLLSTLQPWQLLAGKLIGIGALGILQFGLTVGIGLTAVRVAGIFEIPSIPLDVMGAAILWFVLGFLLYASLFAAAGSLVSRAEDAQAASAPLSVLAVIAYFVSFAALADPDGVAAMVGTYVPFLAPFVVPVRVALQSIEIWAFVLSIGITLATVALVIGLAARIYAGGLLNFGERLKISQAWTRGSE